MYVSFHFRKEPEGVVGWELDSVPSVGDSIHSGNRSGKVTQVLWIIKHPKAEVSIELEED